jgi:hypothetical protein
LIATLGKVAIFYIFDAQGWLVSTLLPGFALDPALLWQNTPPDAMALGQTEITSGGEPELGQQEYWYWLALAAVVVLLIEWYAYHRRQRAPGAFKAVGARGRT